MTDDAARVKSVCFQIEKHTKPIVHKSFPNKCAQVLQLASFGEKGSALLIDNLYHLDILPVPTAALNKAPKMTLDDADCWQILCPSSGVATMLAINKNMLIIGEGTRLAVYDLILREKLTQIQSPYKVAALAHDKKTNMVFAASPDTLTCFELTNEYLVLRGSCNIP